jgi:hypothetical protein
MGQVELTALIVDSASSDVGGIPANDISHEPNPRRRLPCSGPSCSGRIPLPVSASLVKADRLAQWGMITGASNQNHPPIIAKWADESRPAIADGIASIFHPPRTSA